MNKRLDDPVASTSQWDRLRTGFFKRGDSKPGPRGRGDMLVVGAGLALAIGSALFPWYVFFNQDKFGIRALKFEGQEGTTPAPTSLVYQPKLIRQPISPAEVPVMELDLLSTGTLPRPQDTPAGTIPLSDQPFPGQEAQPAEYRVVHAANGRAMLEDENGLWVVQPGSRLPDDSRVASIEKRNGSWVIVTDKAQVIPVGN